MGYSLVVGLSPSWKLICGKLTDRRQHPPMTGTESIDRKARLESIDDTRDRWTPSVSSMIWNASSMWA